MAAAGEKGGTNASRTCRPRRGVFPVPTHAHFPKNTIICRRPSKDPCGGCGRKKVAHLENAGDRGKKCDFVVAVKCSVKKASQSFICLWRAWYRVSFTRCSPPGFLVMLLFQPPPSHSPRSPKNLVAPRVTCRPLFPPTAGCVRGVACVRAGWWAGNIVSIRRRGISDFFPPSARTGVVRGGRGV